jgi:flagellar basal-body rod protein FlgB
MADFFHSATIEMVRLALGAASLRQVVHANNIANANVEGFAPSRVRFEEHLGAVKEQLARGEMLGTVGVSSVPEALIETAWEPTQRQVALDMEVAELSKNALQYQALLKVLSRHLSLTATAIGAGGR